MIYICHYRCPHCKHPDCGEEPMKQDNELVEAISKTDARRFFNQYKPCRHMKIVSIEATTLCSG